MLISFILPVLDSEIKKRDGEPSGERRDLRGEWGADSVRPLYVRTAGHGGADGGASGRPHPISAAGRRLDLLRNGDDRLKRQTLLHRARG